MAPKYQNHQVVTMQEVRLFRGSGCALELMVLAAAQEDLEATVHALAEAGYPIPERSMTARQCVLWLVEQIDAHYELVEILSIFLGAAKNPFAHFWRERLVELAIENTDFRTNFIIRLQAAMRGLQPVYRLLMWQHGQLLVDMLKVSRVGS